MKSVVIGASAGVGRALCDALAAAGHDLVLVASDAEDLRAQAASLRLRHSIRVDFVAARLSNASDWHDPLLHELGPPERIDGLYLPIGFARDDDQGTLDLRAIRDLVETNFGGPGAIVAHCLPAFLERGSGTIVGFGSIAAIRGRGRNVIYAAAKRALQSLFESLIHRTVGTGVDVHFYVLGYVATQQSYGRRLLLPVSSPEAVARAVVRDLGKGSAIEYYPWFWRPVALLIRALPQFVFRRLPV
jgi:short-subunit dehydrogenase